MHFEMNLTMTMNVSAFTPEQQLCAGQLLLLSTSDSNSDPLIHDGASAGSHASNPHGIIWGNQEINPHLPLTGTNKEAGEPVCLHGDGLFHTLKQKT